MAFPGFDPEAFGYNFCDERDQMVGYFDRFLPEIKIAAFGCSTVLSSKVISFEMRSKACPNQFVEQVGAEAEPHHGVDEDPGEM